MEQPTSSSSQCEPEQLSEEFKKEFLFGGRFGDVVNPQTHRVEQAYRLHRYQTVVVARNRTDREEAIAMRLRTGRVGSSQWLNELYVYMIPNFNHPNILPFIGCDKRLKCAAKKKYLKKIRVKRKKDKKEEKKKVSQEEKKDEEVKKDEKQKGENEKKETDERKDSDNKQTTEVKLDTQEKHDIGEKLDHKDKKEGEKENQDDEKKKDDEKKHDDEKKDQGQEEPKIKPIQIRDGGYEGTYSSDSELALVENEQKQETQIEESNLDEPNEAEEESSSDEDEEVEVMWQDYFDMDEELKDLEDDDLSFHEEEKYVDYRKLDLKKPATDASDSNGFLSSDETDFDPQLTTIVHHRPADYRPKKHVQDVRTTLEFWILNDYSGCITLRHYLMMDVISWNQLVKIASGITNGVRFLHEHVDYHPEWNIKKKVDRFIRSTNGSLKKIAFKEQSATIHMKPHFALSIIHRNLSSLNIVLKPGFVPMIWNFGQSFVCHPFQPVNYDHVVDWPIKKILLSSPYSPPEVLSGRTYLNLHALKTIDSYGLGILFWELLTRTVMPLLETGTEEEQRERRDPGPYVEPFASEFEGHNYAAMLQHAVCVHRIRPQFKASWMMGRKTYHFINTARQLWDQDYEARLHIETVSTRIQRLSHQGRDRRCSGHSQFQDPAFDIEKMWPPVQNSTQAPIMPLRRESNVCYEELEDYSDVEETKEQLPPPLEVLPEEAEENVDAAVVQNDQAANQQAAAAVEVQNAEGGAVQDVQPDQDAGPSNNDAQMAQNEEMNQNQEDQANQNEQAGENVGEIVPQVANEENDDANRNENANQDEDANNRNQASEENAS